MTGVFPSQRASNVENVSIWWPHHDLSRCMSLYDSIWRSITNSCSNLYGCIAEQSQLYSRMSYCPWLLVNVGENIVIACLIFKGNYFSNQLVCSSQEITGDTLMRYWICHLLFKNGLASIQWKVLFSERVSWTAILNQGTISLTIFPSQFKCDGNFILLSSK